MKTNGFFIANTKPSETFKKIGVRATSHEQYHSLGYSCSTLLFDDL